MTDRDPQAKFRADETSATDGPWVDASSSGETPTGGGDEGSSDDTLVTTPWACDFRQLHEGDEPPGFRIIRQIGAGGMGAVYLAEQKHPRRTVALKVIRPDRVTPATRRRFQYEADILGKLQHPGIAKVYAAGEFDLGSGPMPYFAMEYIAGARTLTQFAREHKLDKRARLELFATVCDAVHHGHQKGIIHRDLKPANILVDETGWPRIIDFGVARASDREDALATLQTHAGQIVGTLQYMSPEQCSGNVDNIDVRTDVYALGVVLFELLSGELPYDLSVMGLAEALMVVTQTEARSLTTTSAEFRGDLAVIVSKALAKDREERYQSAAELAADIRRYLEDRPILARPIGPIGLLRKWIRRNRQLSTAIALAAAVLAITSTVLITRIVLAERRASQNWLLAEANLREAQEALAATRSTVDLLGGIFEFRDAQGRSRLHEGKVDVEALLDDASEGLRVAPPRLEATEADIRELLGKGYIELRRIDKAREQLTRVLEIRERERPVREAAIAEAAHNLAATYYWDGQYEAALPLYLRAVELRRRLTPGDDADKASSLNNLAATYQKLGRLAEAEQLFNESLAMRQRVLGSESEEIAASLNNLGNLLVAQGKYAQAEERLRQSLAMIIRLRGPDSMETSYATQSLARCLMLVAKYEEAATLFERAWTIRAAKLPPGHTNVASSKLGLAWALAELGRGVEAETLARESLTDFSAALPPGHPDIAWAQEVLGRALHAQQRFAEAEAALATSIDLTRKAESVPRQNLADRLYLRAECLTGLGRSSDARSVLEECIALAAQLGDDELHSRAENLLSELEHAPSSRAPGWTGADREG